MKTSLFYITNKVDNKKIRKIKNERGDEVWVVPSYTLPDNIIMNGGLYPADEIAKSYKSLEGTPAPLDHPINADGEYVSANSEDGILYYQCGIFNKNVRRVKDEKYGHRVYVEKHIHIETAKKSERGLRVLAAIEQGKPIHTSTGVLLNVIEKTGSHNGKKYNWVAADMTLDHDCILLDYDGAATPDDGVGMLVNMQHVEQVSINGQQLAVNHFDVNRSYTELRQRIESAVIEQFRDSEDDWVYVEDFGDDYIIFSKDGGYQMVGYTENGNAIEITTEPEKVVRSTEWKKQSISNSITKTIKGLFNRGKNRRNNREGNDMLLEVIEAALTEAGIDFSEMTEEEKLAAYVKLFEKIEDNDDGDQKPALNTEDLQEVVNQAVANALSAANSAAEKAEREALAKTIKANGSKVSVETQGKMTINELRELAESTKPKLTAFNFASSAPQGGADDLATYSKEDL